MNETQLRKKIVDQAVAWLGRKESDGSHKLIIDTYNAHRPLARGYKVKYTDAWCSTFASAVAIATGMTKIIPTECGCEKHIALFRNMGSWVENDAYRPKPGDYIFYDWDGNGTGDSRGSADHVGIVVDVVGDALKVIEGNKGNAVAYRLLNVNGRYIRGYGVPKYASMETEDIAQSKERTHKVQPGDTLSKIAADAGTTVDELVKANGIKNKNVIHVGQIIMLDGTVEAAVEKLKKLGVIDSPEYWAKTAKTLPHLDTLLMNTAKAAVKARTKKKTAEEGVAALEAAGVINSPEYWLKNKDAVPHMGLLLQALGAAV